MDKHKNADRHKIYPGFRKFYDKGLLKATYKDIALKKEYQCSKCGKKIKIDNYEKMRKRSRLIQWLIRCLVVGSVAMFRGDFHDVFAKIFLSYYKTQDPLFWLWETLFHIIGYHNCHNSERTKHKENNTQTTSNDLSVI